MSGKTPREVRELALLPAGLRDILPHDAAFEATVCETLASSLGSYGYDRIKPPLIEFEEGLINGAGAAVSGDTFRLMDPVSQRMMGIRADMTPQVARVALTRLSDVPRPLRLGYTGEVLRVRGTQLRPERQFRQVGAELIGTESALADVEIIQVAAESLKAIGVPHLSIDLTVPPLVPALLSENPPSEEDLDVLRDALDRKDSRAVRQYGGTAADILCKLVDAAGPGAETLEILRDMSLPEGAARELQRLEVVHSEIDKRIPDLTITVDPVENRGFEYHTGISFTFFSRGERGEIGGGGRYLASLGGNGLGWHEPATGFTLYIDNILRVLPLPEPPRRIFVSAADETRVAAELRGKGWITIAGLDVTDDTRTEALRLGCTHVWLDNKVLKLEPDE